MREERFFTAEETMTNERIDKFLSAQMPDRSRSYIQKLIKDGLVEVNGKQPLLFRGMKTHCFYPRSAAVWESRQLKIW